eukprot:CAMPEP_0167764702 /NCGR_PEP_ID=MMETSP0110_2-20121227/14210_1 /TAXON_ID=629695 /ORGANISM="Gymnochlora sp., Strain CCMP2014" /LENGTH=97 /DNA_ID=CAMNT_0007652197 /DNA_START=280 /DNA_END=573 /DNA_ORIENTATION=+
MRVAAVGRAAYVVRLQNLSLQTMSLMSRWIITNSTRLPTLVVVNSIDRSLSSSMVVHEHDEDKISEEVKSIVASLNTYVEREFLFYVRFIAGQETEE